MMTAKRPREDRTEVDAPIEIRRKTERASQVCEEDWRDEASELLRRGGPSLVVLDLDNTIWPEQYQDMTSPPYISLPLERVLCRSRGHLEPRVLTLMPGVRGVLQFCRDHSLPVAVASRGSQTQALALLSAFRLLPFFHTALVFNARKSHHLRALVEKEGLKYSDILFFDDDRANIASVQPLGVSCCLVREGLSCHNFLAGLRGFAQSRGEENNES